MQWAAYLYQAEAPVFFSGRRLYRAFSIVKSMCTRTTQIFDDPYPPAYVGVVNYVLVLIFSASNIQGSDWNTFDYRNALKHKLTTVVAWDLLTTQSSLPVAKLAASQLQPHDHKNMLYQHFL